MSSTHYLARQVRGKRPLYLTGISAPMASKRELGQKFESRADAERGLADFLDEHVFKKPWLTTGWEIEEVMT